MLSQQYYIQGSGTDTCPDRTALHEQCMYSLIQSIPTLSVASTSDRILRGNSKGVRFFLWSQVLPAFLPLLFTNFEMSYFIVFYTHWFQSVFCTPITYSNSSMHQGGFDTLLLNSESKHVESQACLYLE